MEGKAKHRLRESEGKLFLHDGLNCVWVHVGIIHNNGVALLQQLAGKALTYATISDDRNLMFLPHLIRSTGIWYYGKFN